jgi:hypothetical protein
LRLRSCIQLLALDTVLPKQLVGRVQDTSRPCCASRASRHSHFVGVMPLCCRTRSATAASTGEYHCSGMLSSSSGSSQPQQRIGGNKEVSNCRGLYSLVVLSALARSSCSDMDREMFDKYLPSAWHEAARSRSVRVSNGQWSWVISGNVSLITQTT